MKLIVYRDKKTNQITNWQGFVAYCTDGALKSYNENEKCPTTAEVVDLAEDSIAYHFYAMKTAQIKDEAENLRDLRGKLESVIDRIDDRLRDFDEWFEEEKKNKETKE